MACNAADVFMETVCEREKYGLSMSVLDGESPDVLCIRLICSVQICRASFAESERARDE